MKRILCAIALVASTLPASAATPSLPKIETLTLSNGLPVYLIQRSDLPIVSGGLVVRAGQVFEPAEKAGLANLTASLIEKGTSRYTAEALAEESEFVGGSIGSSVRRDSALISFSFLKKDLNTALDLFGEMVKSPTFPQDEFDKEKKQVAAGLESKLDDPESLLGLATARAFYGSHPYARPTIGTLTALNNITRRDVVGFYTRLYRPNNAFMAVVGDIDIATLREKLEKTLEGWQGEAIQPEAPKSFAPPQGKRVILVDADINQAYLSLSHEGIRRDAPSYQQAYLASYLLGGGSVSRLYREIRGRQGLAYSVGSVLLSNRYGYLSQIYLETKTSSAAEAVKGILEEVRQLRTERVPPSELNTGKRAVEGAYSLSLETNDSLLDYLTLIGQYRLGTDYLSRYPGLIRNIKPEEIKAMAERCFDTGGYVLTVVGKADELKEPLARFGTVEVVSKRELIQ